MNNNRALGAFVPACLKAWRSVVVFAVLSTSLAVFAQSPLRPASGTVPGNAKAVPMVAAAASLTSDQNLTYTFPKPELIRGNDGLATVIMSGLDNFGEIGAPALPYLPVRIAIPQGRTVKSVTVTIGDLKLVDTGITLRHVEKPVIASSAVQPAPTLRNDAIYSSDNAYPAKPESNGRVSWKHGVGFYEMALCPIVYRPVSGEVSYCGTITVSVTLNPVGSSATRGAAAAQVAEDISAHTPFQSQERAASVLALLDNPAVVSGYRALNAVPRASTLENEIPLAYVKPVLPCVPTNTFRHVIITSEFLKSPFLGLVQYRRQNGSTSTLVDVADVIAAYDNGEDRQTIIRKFIKDAYEKWGTEYVLLGGDDSIIPVRKLYATASDEADELPSDLYYQCLDGDFDANGNGVYGEEDDDVDLYSEVSIGRVSAESPDEVRNWFAKMKKYDADCRALADYTRGVLFVGEHMGPKDNTYAKPLMEIIRHGTKYAGGNGGIVTYGFDDATDKFDLDKHATLYAQDKEWGAEDIAQMINSNAFSVVNHMGHSNYNYNMQMSNEEVDALDNENPVFVYSQGCIAGAIDQDCIAEHFTTSTEHGAFAGVWNSRYGWYGFNGMTGIASTTGGSELYHRRFWDAVFRDGVTEMGDANALSHERNAPLINGSCMRWCYYETNLFGDPMQCICGPTSKLYFDREAYKSTATATVIYECAYETNEVEVVLSAVRQEYLPGTSTIKSSTQVAVLEPESVTLLPAGIVNNRYVYTGTVDLPSVVLNATPSSLQHDDLLIATLADGTLVSPSVYIDDVAPAFRDVELRNTDENLIDATWTTYSPDKSGENGVYTDELTVYELYVSTNAPFADPLPLADADDEYAVTHSVRVENLNNGLYYVRILAADKAGNTNIWCSAEVSDQVASEDLDEYGQIIVASRNTRAFFNMETDASAWEANGCWQLGTPSFGPLNASRCYGTVINGRYPDGVNDALVSPPVSLGVTPTITFRQWYDIEATPEGYSNLDKADYGIVEVLVTGANGSGSGAGAIEGAWRNVSQYARVDRGSIVQGQSEGWEDVRILLPSEYDGKTIRIRFRFVSDDFTAEEANPAGWYIDNVRFLDVPDEGVALSITEIEDNANNDGYAQPGETVILHLASCNVSYEALTIPSGRGSVTVSAAGIPAGSVKLVGNSPAPISYPVLLPGELIPADNTVSVEIASSVPYGTVVLVSQTLVGENGKNYESYASFTVADPCVVAGSVKQPTGNPVVSATVSVNASDGDYIVMTDENGEFSIPGLSSGRLIKAVASYGLASVEQTITTPAEDLEFILPLAEIGISDGSLEFSMNDTDPAITGTFVISNFFVLAAEAGNIGPSANLEYEITGFLNDDGEPYEWLTLLSPAEGEIAPDTSLTVEFQLSAEGVDASVPRTAKLVIRSNAWNEGLTVVTITLNITGTVELQPYGIEVKDDENADGNNNDGDGFLEFGETGTISLTVRNTSTAVSVESFTGTFSTDANLTLVGPYEEEPGIVKWGKIFAGSNAKCDDPIIVADCSMNNGEIATIHVSGDAVLTDGSFCHQELDFVWTNEVRNAVSGIFNVEDFSVSPTATKPVEGAKVLLYGENGDFLSSGYTTEKGEYSVNGLIPGAKYWVTFSTLTRDNVNVPPMGYVITEEENDPNVDGTNGIVFDPEILGAAYGEKAVPHFRFVTVDIADADGDGSVDFGEEFSLFVSVKNDGTASAKNIVAEVFLPETGFEFDQCMEVVDSASTPISLVDPQATVALTNMTVRAFDSSMAEAGNFQRFIIDVHEEGVSDPERHWFFDFKVEIAPRLSVSGTLSAPEGVSLAGAKIALLDESKVLIAERGFAAADVTSSDYIFEGIAPGSYTVAVTALPAGYVCQGPNSQTLVLADYDVENINFTLAPWAISGDVDEEYRDDENGGIHIEINEGDSAEVPVTFSNTGVSDEEIQVKLVYNRKANEVLTMDQISDEIAATRANLFAKIGNNWTKLDPAVFSKNEIEVTFRKGTSVEARDAYLARHGFRAKYHFKTIPASIAVPGNTGAEIAAASAAYANAASFKSSAADDIVVTVQPSVICHGIQSIDIPPQDTLYSEQWALNNTRQDGGTLGCDIGAESAWTYSQSVGSKEVRVAITDTGVLYSHPDLQGNWSGIGWNYVYDNELCEDGEGHGTHVAGIIGAVGNNGIGVSGVNWNVGLVSCRISCPDGFGGSIWATTGDIARSFEDSYTEYGCCANNNSWGTRIFSQILYDAMEEAKNHDMLFVIAAGNTADNLDVAPSYPAAYSRWLDNVIVVAAADSDDNITSFSSYNPELVHLAAPGYNVLSTFINTARGNAASDIGKSASGEGNYAYLSGTSMAAPYVTGAAALLKSIVPTAPYTVIRDAILNGVRKDDNLAQFVSTSGHLDIGNSVRLLGNMWIRFPADDGVICISTNLTVPAGSSVELPLIVNNPAVLSAGTYSATLIVSEEIPVGEMAYPNVMQAAASDTISLVREIPVSLKVNPDVVAKIDSVKVTAEDNPDGHLAYGETASIDIAVKNTGSRGFEKLTAELVAVNGEVISGEAEYGNYLPGGQVTDPALGFTVQMPDSGDTAEFTLKVYENGDLVAELPVTFDLFNGNVVTVIVTDNSAKVPGAVVEVIGQSAAKAVTDADGTAYLAIPAAEVSATTGAATGVVQKNGSANGTIPPKSAEWSATLDPVGEGIVPGSVSVSVTVGNGSFIFVDDGNGNLAVPTAQFGTGTVNYTTGAIRITLTGAVQVAAPVSVSYKYNEVNAAGYTLRVLTDTAVRYIDTAFDPAVPTTEVELAHAQLTAPAEINIVVTEGTTLSTNLTLSASAAISGTLDIAKGAKIAVFDDCDDSAVLVASLRKIGFTVDYYPENYQIVRYFNPATEKGEIRYMVRYSWDAALVYNYDAVISVLSGANGGGRLLSDSEAEAYEGYVERGGKVFIAGNTPLARPDNLSLAALVGLDEESCDTVTVEDTVARANGELGAPFVALAAGDCFPIDSGTYDSLGLSAAEGTYTAEATAAAKIYESKANDLGGQFFIWNGLYTDWNAEGAAIDILRGSLYSRLVADKAPAWIATSADSFAITANGETGLQLDINSGRDLGVGDYTAVIYLLAETDGTPVTPVTVNVSVVPPILNVGNLSGHVTDWGERPLSGNGGDASAMFQVIYAGPDGLIDPPAADGTPTGDDVLLVASGTGLPLGYFGCGTSVPANAGQFSAAFNLSFEGFNLDMEDEINVYVRAWDGASPAASVAYGDSELRTVTFTDNVPDAIDFGSWVVGIAAGDDTRDSNGDSIPDAWAFEFRPDLDPRAPVESLGNESSMSFGDQFSTAVAPQPYASDGNPARVFVTEKFVVVLEKYTHRLAVYNRVNTNELVHYFGATTKNGPAEKYTVSSQYEVSDADGAFNQPFGMALDLYTTNSVRFAVADTGNNRVQLFEFDPDTGDITFLSKYGAETSGDGGHSAGQSTFKGPQAVAFMKGGDLLIADTGNYRVIRIRTTGNVFGAVTGNYGFPEKQTLLTGICADDDSGEGFWVADANNNKQRISFHHTVNFSSEPVVSFGTRDSQDFVTPSDVQVWSINGVKRICATDRQGSRLRVLRCQSDDSGSYTGISVLVDLGYKADLSLEDYQKLLRPVGVFPVADTNLVYVADFGHNRIVWYSLALDADGDGMDDLWEDMNGLDSSRDDAFEDADGDGLLNIGEFRSGCDPQNTDTDGDGVGDLAEMINLRDPLTAEADPLDLINVISVTVLDEDGNPTNKVEVGKSVTIAVAFDVAPVKNGFFTLANKIGETVGSGTPDIAGNEMTFAWTATEKAIGNVDVKFQLPECDPPVTNSLALFEVVAGDQPDPPPPPEPEFEEVEWMIKSISFVEGTPSVLRLKWDSPAVTDGTECKFRLGYKDDLSAALWDTNSIPVITVAAPAEGVGDVDLTKPTVNPGHCFFKLWWINKEKGN